MKYKYIIKALGGLFLLSVAIYGILYARWRHLWALEDVHQSYYVEYHNDDTLRVAMIGDSWAGMHYLFGMDSILQRQLSNMIDSRVKVRSSGKGGETTRGIYRLMYEDGSDGTCEIISAGLDYCIIMAGINDAVANMGVRQYLYHYRLILDFLLSHRIRPVVVEIPNVNIWALYSGKSIKDLLGDYLKSIMTGCGRYNYQEYRESMLSMLEKEDLMKDVVFIPMKEWNGEGESINERLFLNDQIHLNQRGYKLLDSCIAVKISEDYKRR